MSRFLWTEPREKAAVLLAENDLSDETIAARVGVTRRTLARWKLDAEFAAKVGDHVGQIQVAMLRLTIAKKHERLRVLDRMHDKVLRVIDERADEYADAAASGKTVPAGGGTGLVVRSFKQVGTGHDAMLVEEFAVDTGTLRELRALEEQAAKELGQWVEKTQYEDMTRVVEIVGVPDDAI